MTSSQKVAEEILNQRKIKFSLHPTQPKMVTIGSDNDLIIWDTATHKAVYSDTLASEPTCIKFSPGPDVLLTTGYENGLVEISTIQGQKDKKKQEHRTSTLKREVRGLSILGDGSKKPRIEEPAPTAILYRVLQSISEPQCNVLNIAFSKSGSLMAISYLNKKDPDEGEDKITGIVNVYKQTKADFTKKDGKDPLYLKWQTVTTAHCLGLAPMVNHACYFMNFSLNEQYLCINFQQFDKYNLREHDDKERNYLVWDLLKGERQENMDLVIETEVGNLNFPNHINAQYRYHEKYLEANNLLQTEG